MAARATRPRHHGLAHPRRATLHHTAQPAPDLIHLAEHHTVAEGLDVARVRTSLAPSSSVSQSCISSDIRSAYPCPHLLTGRGTKKPGPRGAGWYMRQS